MTGQVQPYVALHRVWPGSFIIEVFGIRVVQLEISELSGSLQTQKLITFAYD